MLLPRRFVPRRLPLVRHRGHPSFEPIGKLHCHCRRGFAIIVRSILSVAGPIAPTIAASTISSIIAPSNRLAVAELATGIATGRGCYVATRDHRRCQVLTGAAAPLLD